MKKILYSIIFIFIIAANNRVLFAQFNTGIQISGTVTDEHHQPLEYVSVTLVNFGLNTSTDKYGKYQFSNIPEGNYLLSFKLTGHQSKTLEITVNQKQNTFDTELSETLILIPTIDVTGSTKASEINNSVYSITSVNVNELFK
jgi:hypothetical protein